MLEYIYTLEIPELSTIADAKSAYMLGDKYNLPKLHQQGSIRLCALLRLCWNAWAQVDEALKGTFVFHFQDIFTWTHPGADRFKKVILDSFCQSASDAIEDTTFRHLLSQNKDFDLDFMRALAKSHKSAPDKFTNRLRVSPFTYPIDDNFG